MILFAFVDCINVLLQIFLCDVQGLRNEFHLGVAHSNADFEKVDFQKKIYIEFRNLGVARATPATPVP